MKAGGFFAELKRRNVYKVAVAYAVVGWLVMQVAATVVPALHLSDAITSTVVLLVLLGFPVALVLAWVFEVTLEGIKRTGEVTPNESIPHRTGRKLLGLTIGLASLAAGLFAWRSLQPTVSNSPAWSMLGLIDAALGRKADAVAKGKRACELLPLKKDAWEGPSYVVNLAIIYSWLGEKDLALEQLETSVQNPSGISYGELKLQPFWDSLRGDPRFEKIVASVAPKGTS